MDCECIKGNFNFTLDALDTKNLLFTDISDWMKEDYYIKPDSYVVKVTIPNQNNETSLEVNTVGPNLIKAEDIGVLGCFPDGIYCFKTDSCGNTFTRYKAVTADMECRLKCALIQGESPFKIAELTSQIKSIHYSLERDLTIEANKIYKIVKREIDLIECECNCCKN